MSIKSYIKKRNFHTTAEPAPKPVSPKADQKLIFVVQKHQASHLHYDFRLEVDGVLKSWAVPKGPSLNPQNKRLAMMVEDHPYDYKDFEGIIPKGNYGAGEVIIWDEGYYEPLEKTADINKQMLREIKKGHVSIILHGKKLKGEFTLIRIKTDERNSWLLIKKQDKHSSDQDVLEKNRSVRSRKTINSLAQSKKKSKLPQSIQPMLAKLVEKPFNKKDWLFEVKWDGFRIIALVDEKKVQLYSRNQKNYSEIFHPVTTELAALKMRAVFDGEMVVLDKEGRSSFQLLQQYQLTGKGHLKYLVFDLLWYDGQDFREKTLLERKELLFKILSKESPHIKISEHIYERGIAFFKAAKKQDLEGIIAKNINSHYKEGQRTTDWLKIKSTHRQEAIICGYTQPRGSRKNIGALVLGIYKKGKLIYIGHSGSGLNTAMINELKQRLDHLQCETSPFDKVPKTNMPVTWVKPKLVCEIEFTEWTDDGQMRHPIFLGLRDDKKPEVVKKEVIVHPPDKNNIIILNRHRLTLSNPDKIFWPDEGYTKKDVIDYYLAISKWILPYLKDRPESLLRHPNGINGDNFFQKNMEHTPDWVKIQPIYSEHEQRNINYLICQNEATLIYMANLGCIEINPWFSRLKHLDKPDFCIIDLDPEEIDFKAVVKSALAVKKFLDELKIDCYCKTSGATGLHIAIPLGAKYTYDQSKQFAELIVGEVNQRLPKITSILRSPAKRQGKVYLDFLQNRQGQTITAPYAIRPRPGATVSTPLLWEEVNGRLNPSKFTIKTIIKRLDEYGDLWKPVLGKGAALKNL